MNKLKSIFKKDKDDEPSSGHSHSHTSTGSSPQGNTSAQRQSYESPTQTQSYGSAPSSRSQANTSQAPAYGSTPQSQTPAYGSTPQSQTPAYGSTPQSQTPAYGSTPQSQSQSQTQSYGNTPSQGMSSREADSYGNTSSQGRSGATSAGGATAPTGSAFPAANAPSTGREYAENPQGVVMHTSVGAITIALFAGQTPRTCKNFATLAATGKYDNVVFHRIIPGFMIQGGDPDGTGRGGKSIYGPKFEDEFDDSLKHTSKGVLSMANSGPNTNGSQFFITLGPTPHLNGKHTVFGQVADGMDVVDRLGAVKTGAQDRPIQEVKILRCDVF